MILNLSASSIGSFPDDFKNSNMTPIFKSGDRIDIGNYTSISIFGKIFGKVVHSVDYTHVAPFINESRHGFVRKKSTISNLISFIDYTAESLVKKIQLDAIYTDVPKAFDKFNILSSKIKSFGINGMILSY